MTMDIVPHASTSASGAAATAAGTSSDASALQTTSRRLLKKRARGLTARTTCIHPQLRDLLVVAGGQVIAASYQTLSRYTIPKRRDPLQQLTFIPNVLVQGCGLICAGGQHAELYLRSVDPSSTWSIHTTVGKSINNSAHICPSPPSSSSLSTPRIHVCNNDCGIYRYDLHFPKRWGTTEVTQEWNEDEDPLSHGQPELDFVDRIALSTPVNHCSVSPDGRNMVAVGDTNEIFVYSIGSHGHVTLIDTIEGSDDASFSTSWSRSGDGFAVASQDGTVNVFDRRYLRPVKTFHSVQRGPSGAARVVKYSQGPHELLAFTEQKNYIHVIDARTYEYSETIYIPDVELEEVGRTGGISDLVTPISPSTIGTGRRSLLSNQIGVGGSSNTGGLNGSRGASYSFLRGLRDNPWDTMPTDDAYQTLLNMPDCPFGMSPSHEDGLIASLPSPSRRPWLSGNARRSPTAQVSTVPITVGAVINGLHESSQSALNNAIMNPGSGSSAITGLDWDATGSHLYACTERIILEWQVDSASRRSHPAATIL